MAFVLGEEYDHRHPMCASLKVKIRALIRQMMSVVSGAAPDCAFRPAEQRIGGADRPKGVFCSGAIDSIFTCRKQSEALGALISIAHVSYDERHIAHGFDRLRELTAFADKTRRRHLQVATRADLKVSDSF